MTDLVFPRRPRGRLSAEKEEAYRENLDAFCQAVLQIQRTLDFNVSSRGWAYIFENRGVITKADIDACQALINACRKSGDLPLDICAVDESRAFECIQQVDDTSPEEEAQDIVDYVREAHLRYCPQSFWADQEFYVQMVVEKIDLKSLFRKVCTEFHVPIANAKGWADLHLRADMMRRFEEWEAEGKQCVLLYCGDHDPAGLNISTFLRKNMEDLSGAVEWWPGDLIIDRFGLNADFIEANNLTWIDNLITSRPDANGNAKDLADPRHKDHRKEYVQSYLEQFGARKVEANALVVAPDAGRTLCREAILKYLLEDAPARFQAILALSQDEVHEHVVRLLAEEASQ